jgi:hypothetical protein
MNSLKVLQFRTFIFLILLGVFISKIQAQHGTNQLIINSEDSLFISVFVNERLINSSYTNKIRIGNLVNESHHITIALDSGLKKINKSIFFNENESVIFLDLISNDTLTHLIFNGESKIQNIENDSVHSFYMYFDSIVNSDSTVLIDKSLKNNLILYDGKKGCNNPIKNVDSILINIDSIFSSEHRLAYLKSILENKCISTKHLRSLLLSISYEDHRIELCEIVYPEIYDLDNFQLLINLFKFEKSKNLFLKIFEENDK